MMSPKIERFAGATLMGAMLVLPPAIAFAQSPPPPPSATPVATATTSLGAQAPTPVPRTKVMGVVVFPDGKPAALARVGLLTLPRPGDAPAAPVITTADESGGFSFEVNPASAFSLHAHLAPAALVSLPRVSGGQKVTLRLATGDRLSGGVVDATSAKPLAGAAIEASEWDVSPFADVDPDFGLVRRVSDAKGRFNLAGLAPSGRMVVRARLRGYAAGSATTVPPSGLVFRLEPGHDLAGVVKDTAGQLVGKATVILRPTVRRGSDTVTTLQSNASGRFEAIGLRNQPYDATITAPGFAPYLKDAIPGDQTSLAVTLEKVARVTGRLINEEDKPLRGRARVRSSQGHAMPSEVDRQVVAETALNGTFELTGLKSGTNVIELQAFGFSPVERTVEVGRPGESVSLGDVRFEQGLAIIGRVTTADDLPVPGARVQATRTIRSGPGPAVSFFAQTGDDGRFELKGLLAEPYQLVISADGFARQTKRAAPSDESVGVVLRPVIRLSGRLVDPSGQPVGRARVSAQKGTEQFASAMATSASDGLFTLELGDTGETQMSALAEGFTAFSKSVLVEGDTHLGDIAMSRGLLLRGIVLDTKGTAIVGARVENQTTRQFPPTFSESDEKGRFEMTGATPGRVRLVATHTQFSPGQVYVEIKEGEEPEEAQITLGAGARIEGTVRHRDNTPVSQAVIMLMAANMGDSNRPSLGSPMAITQADGSFFYEHVFPGTLNVTLMTGQQGSYTNVDQKAVSAVEGETAIVNLTLRATTVRGVLRRKEGPVSGLRVSVVGGLVMMSGGQDRISSLVGDIPWRSAVTDAEGRYALRVVGPLKGRVNVADGRGTLLAKEVEIPDADELALPLDLVGVRVTGRVADSEGRGIAEANVNALRTAKSEAFAATRSFSARTDKSGTFVFELEPGDYRVTATAEGFVASTPVSTSVATSDVSVSDITLSAGGSLSGRVTLRGIAVSGARVDAGSGSSENLIAQYTGPDGYFAFKGLPGGDIRLVASDGTGHIGVHFLSHGSTEPIEVKLLPAARIEVTVVGPKEALAEVDVSIQKVDDIPHRVWTRTDPSGRSVLFAPAGTVTVNATSGTSGSNAVVQTVAGETIAVTIELKPMKPPPKE